MTRDAGKALNLKDALGRNPLPRVEGLRADAELSREGDAAPGFFSGEFDDCDHDQSVSTAYVSLSSTVASDLLSKRWLEGGMSTLGHRIRLARNARKMTQQAIAREFGITRNSVSLWESDDASPEQRKIARLAEILAVDTDWLLTGEGGEDEIVPAKVSTFLRPDRTSVRHIRPFREMVVTPGDQLVSPEPFPIYAAAQGGEGHMIVTFDATQWVKTPAILEGIRGAYGILVTGDSMDPEFRPGDMALINPHLHPMRDETHVFYDHPPDGEATAMIKRLVGWSDATWRLRQFNPLADFDAPRLSWPTAHRVVGKYNRR